jgi:hypothetical protein
MRLFDALFGKFAAYVANYGNRPADPIEITRALEAYDRLVRDIRRGVSAEELASNELFQKSDHNRLARVT